MGVAIDPGEPVPEPASTGSFLTRHPRWRLALVSFAVASAYVAGGKAGLLVAGPNPSVSAVWPPTGIAIAALLLGGSELWPAVFAGAFVVNFTTTGDLASTLGIATGNTLEALIGSYLANRFASGRRLLDHPRSVLTFAVLSGLGACSVAATIGAGSLTLAHLAQGQSFLSLWAPWWLGDAIGAIEITPLILAVAARASGTSPLRPVPGWPERVAVAGAVAGIAWLVFAQNPPILFDGTPILFLVILPIAWAAFRFGPLGAVAAVSTTSVVAVVATVTGRGPFTLLPADVSLLALRVFIGSLALAALLVAADTVQHREWEQELYRARKELQRALGTKSSELDTARALANVGTWTYDGNTRKMVWSEEMYRIFGYGEERFPVDLERATARMASTDRDRFRSAVSGLLASDGTGPAVEQRIRLELPDGGSRTIRARSQALAPGPGRGGRVTGTVQDISERANLEREVQRLGGSEPTAAEPEGFVMWMIPWMAQRRR